MENHSLAYRLRGGGFGGASPSLMNPRYATPFALSNLLLSASTLPGPRWFRWPDIGRIPDQRSDQMLIQSTSRHDTDTPGVWFEGDKLASGTDYIASEWRFGPPVKPESLRKMAEHERSIFYTTFDPEALRSFNIATASGVVTYPGMIILKITQFQNSY